MFTRMIALVMVLGLAFNADAGNLTKEEVLAARTKKDVEKILTKAKRGGISTKDNIESLIQVDGEYHNNICVLETDVSVLESGGGVMMVAVLHDNSRVVEWKSYPSLPSTVVDYKVPVPATSEAVDYYAVALIIVDGYIDDIDAEFTVQLDNEAPVCEVSGTTGATEGDERTWTFEASDDKAITYYEILWGDDESMTGDVKEGIKELDFDLAHSYDDAAKYTITFTVYDDEGKSGTCTFSVYVRSDDTEIEPDEVTFTLMAASGEYVKAELSENELKTYTIDGVDYETEVLSINTSDMTAEFKVNGEQTGSIEVGVPYTLTNGAALEVNDIEINSVVEIEAETEVMKMFVPDMPEGL